MILVAMLINVICLRLHEGKCLHREELLTPNSAN